jgi:hypothetical protein
MFIGDGVGDASNKVNTCSFPLMSGLTLFRPFVIVQMKIHGFSNHFLRNQMGAKIMIL